MSDITEHAQASATSDAIHDEAGHSLSDIVVTKIFKMSSARAKKALQYRVNARLLNSSAPGFAPFSSDESSSNDED